MLCSSERRRRFSALQTAGRAAATARGSSLGKIPILGVGPGPAYACTSPHEVVPTSPAEAGDRARELAPSESTEGAPPVDRSQTSPTSGLSRPEVAGVRPLCVYRCPVRRLRRVRRWRGLVSKTRWSDRAPPGSADSPDLAPLLLAAHAPEQNAEAEARQAQGPDDDMPQPRLGRAHDRRRWAIRDDRINSDARVQHQNGAPAGRTEVTASRPGGAFASSVCGSAAGRCQAASKPRRPAPHRAWPTPSSGSTSARSSCCTCRSSPCGRVVPSTARRPLGAR